MCARGYRLLATRERCFCSSQLAGESVSGMKMSPERLYRQQSGSYSRDHQRQQDCVLIRRV
jgi:hypothetical protein